MHLLEFRNGRFHAYNLEPRTRSDTSAVEQAIRSFANEKGDIDSISILVGNECIHICHVDEARVVSRMLTADHHCFTDHLYDKGFEPCEGISVTVNPSELQHDAYYDNEVWKLDFQYEQNQDIGTPSFGSSKAHADVY